MLATLSQVSPNQLALLPLTHVLAPLHLQSTLPILVGLEVTMISLMVQMLTQLLLQVLSQALPLRLPITAVPLLAPCLTQVDPKPFLIKMVLATTCTDLTILSLIHWFLHSQHTMKTTPPQL